MKLIVAILLMLAPALVSASGTVDIKSLYESRSRTPSALLPFLVGGTAVTSANSILNFQAAAADADCRVMRDPFNGLMLLVKCSSESQAVTLKVQVLSGTQMLNVSYGPFQVIAATNLPPITPTDPTGPTPAQIQAGSQLYSVNCVNCHNPANTLRGRTSAQIATAITAQPMMNGTGGGTSVNLKSKFSASDLANIAAYLGSL